MCPTSPSTWASQGNSSTLVRPSTPPASRKKHRVTLLLPPDAWIMFFNLLCLSSLVSLPRPHSPPPLFHFLFFIADPVSPLPLLCLCFIHLLPFSNLLIAPCSSANLPLIPASSFTISTSSSYSSSSALFRRIPVPRARLRIGRGGPGRRPAALLRQGVLVVPAHVEPHAAAPLPQPVGAGGADVAEQEVCHGRTCTQMDKLDTNLKEKKNPRVQHIASTLFAQLEDD